MTMIQAAATACRNLFGHVTGRTAAFAAQVEAGDAALDWQIEEAPQHDLHVWDYDSHVWGDYQPATPPAAPGQALKPCHFSIDDGPPFDGFRMEGAWRGSGQVAVTPGGCRIIAAWLTRRGKFQAAIELLERRTGRDGLVSLANGYAVTILNY